MGTPEKIHFTLREYMLNSSFPWWPLFDNLLVTAKPLRSVPGIGRYFPS